MLSIAVYPKTSEPGDYDAQKAEDYKAIGAVVDEFKVMTYAYSGPWSKPGPQMPLSWAKQVLAFARSKVPAAKVYMGLPFFGFDWQGSSAKYVLWKDVAAAERQVRRQRRPGRGIRRGDPALQRCRRRGPHGLLPGPRRRARQAEAG